MSDTPEIDLLTTPVLDHSLDETRRMLSVFHMYRADGELDLTPEYQRASVWTVADQRKLWWSMLSGVPIGCVYINMRDDFYEDPKYRVIDGKQRLEAYFAFLDGEISLPKLWFAPRVTGGGKHLSEEVSADAPDMVFFSDLTRNGQTYALRHPSCLLIETKLKTVADEARMFNLVNVGGVSQTEETIAHAESIAADQLSAGTRGVATPPA